MKKIDEAEMLRGLIQQENKAYEILYKFYFPVVENFILKNSGSHDDAQDIFQETIIVLLQKVPLDSFELTSSLKTYIFAISSNLWLKRLRESKRLYKTVEHISKTENNISDPAQEEPIEKSWSEKMDILLEKVPSHCQFIIKSIFYLGKKFEEIKDKLGYKNKHSAQNQKYKCMQQLKKAANQS